MALTKYTASTAIIAALSDLPNATDGLTAAQLKAKFDEGGEALKTYINSTLIPALEAITDGSSGADQIGATTVIGLTGNTVQVVLEALKTLVDTKAATADTYTRTELNNGQLDTRYFTETEIQATTDSASGADKTGATAISGLTGATVQALLEALKTLVDTKSNSTDIYTKTELNNGQLDTRYFTEAELQSIVDANSGADKVGATAITDLTGNTVQAILENLRNTLKSIVDASSGADFVNSTAITGVTGTTVQAQLESIKSLIDAIYTKAQLDAGQLDNRYFTETELQSITDTASGADKVGATQVATGSGTTVQAILEWLYAELASVVLGQIPNDSLTNAKLGTDIKVGSLASLTTTEKTNVVGSINEVDADLTAHEADIANPHGVTKTQVGLSVVDNVKQMPIAGGTFTGVAVGVASTAYTTRQLRNVIQSIGDPTGGSNGDVWLKYE